MTLDAIRNSIDVGLERFTLTLRAATPELDQDEARSLSRSMRRSLLAATLDGRMTQEELRVELHTLVDGARSRSRTWQQPASVLA